MFLYCVCGIFVIVIGGFVSQLVIANKDSEKDILLKASKNDAGVISSYIPVKATIKKYLLTVQFDSKINDHVNIYVKKGNVIVYWHELTVATKRLIDIDLSSLDEGEYHFGMHNKFTNEHFGGVFFIEPFRYKFLSQKSCRF